MVAHVMKAGFACRLTPSFGAKSGLATAAPGAHSMIRTWMRGPACRPGFPIMMAICRFFVCMSCRWSSSSIWLLDALPDMTVMQAFLDFMPPARHGCALANSMRTTRLSYHTLLAFLIENSRGNGHSAEAPDGLHLWLAVLVAVLAAIAADSKHALCRVWCVAVPRNNDKTQ